MAPGDMASAKRTPKVSRISRDRTVAYVRKQRSTADGGDAGGSEANEPDEPDEPDKAADPADPAAAQPGAKAAVKSEARTAPAADPVPQTAALDLPAAAGATATVADPAPISPPTPRVGSWPDATPPSTKPVDPERARMNTDAKPAHASLGAPPEPPRGAGGVAAADVSAAEDPTRMPGPREIPSGHPDDPAPPPGTVPRGDSRSMRRRTDQDEFALVYRIQTYVITRAGKIGRRGQWRVVEYPTSSAASHAYAKECSRFVSEGFSDYRG